jgi:hypothetical protein
MEKIKLGKLHKGYIDFDSLNVDKNEPFSKIKIIA